MLNYIKNVPALPLGDEFNVCPGSHILHSFTEYRVVHEFEKILFKLVRRRLTLTGVEVDVGLQPWRLLELESSVDSGHS